MILYKPLTRSFDTGSNGALGTAQALQKPLLAQSGPTSRSPYPLERDLKSDWILLGLWCRGVAPSMGPYLLLSALNYGPLC